MTSAVDHYIIPHEFIQAPPADHLTTTLYVKHVNIHGKWVQPPILYNKLEGGNLFIEYLITTHGHQVIDRLMTMNFQSEGEIDCSFAILARGIVFSGAVYNFLGHSNSQLKDKTCFLMNGTHEEIHSLLAQFTDFSKIKTSAKRAKRIGLLFSSFGHSIPLHQHEYEVIEDVERGGYIFTDGCGFMSDSYAQCIQEVANLEAKPCVVQIRYQGFKGVLVLNGLLGTKVKVQFRKSMRKFTIPDESMNRTCTTFGVVKCSRPYTLGYLNTQITMLLADSGVDHGYLTRLQESFHDMLKELRTSDQAAEMYLRIKGEHSLIELLHTYGLRNSRLQRALSGLRSRELRKMQKDKGTEPDDTNGATASKLRILVPNSRVVFGVCDPFGELEYGQCVFHPTLYDEVRIAEYQVATEVMVVRNPCYYPGDIRVLKLVKNLPQYAYLNDCIVFPTKGSRPHADESSGGDLDGDEFFVSWDQDLIPCWRLPPFDYSASSPLTMIPRVINDLYGKLVGYISGALSHLLSPPLSEEAAAQRARINERMAMLMYFSSYNNDLVCRVNGIFMKYAALYGPSCDECVYLNRKRESGERALCTGAGISPTCATPLTTPVALHSTHSAVFGIDK
ncbi:probable RNA-dependent RNA polymerase 1 isoform X2 [Nematostella vectensis]|uniref:probable RNA-dependent RNA polymerase 1 isoform X2 n=1 Tax=Nematostella vectensis TaxID=45351 RepID=UPI00207757C8|nr:probable RNA-dependent RNA polymerase 1 isoform X2 [Nematostella vectensis]